MNRHKLLRGGVHIALMLLLTLLIVSSLVACGNLKRKESKVELVPHDAETLFVESYDYVSMFEATVDDKPFEIEAENIDASAVKLNEAGIYNVKCEIEVNGKKYNATAKLTVVAPRAFSVDAKSSELKVVLIGEQLDLTTLFSATVSSQPYALKAEDIDSDLDLTKEGLYEATASLTIDGVTKSATQKIYVIPVANYDISGAMQYNYSNYSAKISVEEDDNGNKVSETITVKDAEGKYHYESKLPLSNGGESHKTYEFQLDTDTGAVLKTYYYNDTAKEWEKRATDPDTSAFVNHVEADEEFAQYFSLGEDGMFVADADEETLSEMAWSLLCYNTSLIGDVTSLKVRVESNKIVKIVVESEYVGEGDYVDTYLITVELGDFGAVEFDLPYFEPVVEITPANAEVYVGDATEYDFLSMFTVKVDGDNYTLGEGDVYSIEQSVDFNVAADYDITLKLKVKEGRVEHTVTAKFTVKEKPVEKKTFHVAMEEMIANCTMSKTNNSSSSATIFLVDGNATYNQNLKYLFDTSRIDGKNTQRYTVNTDNTLQDDGMKSGSFLRLCDLSAIIDDFVAGDDGITYTYTGDQLTTISTNAGALMTTMYKAINIEIVFQNNSIESIKFNFKTGSSATAKDAYHLYTISAIGTTELPVQLPKA